MAIATAAMPPKRDPKTGLYVIGDTELTLSQYEAGLQVLHLREQAAIAQTSR